MEFLRTTFVEPNYTCGGGKNDFFFVCVSDKNREKGGKRVKKGKERIYDCVIMEIKTG
jgi:hypothetical protein